MPGDFNVIPTDADVYNPKAWRKDALLQPETREAYRRAARPGLDGRAAHVIRDEQIYTFWDYFRQHGERDRGLRIDHLLLNPGVAPAAQVRGRGPLGALKEKASDHAPTWIEVAAPKP